MPTADVAVPFVTALRMLTATYEVDERHRKIGAVHLDLLPFRTNPPDHPHVGRLLDVVEIGPRARFESRPAVYVSIIGFSQYDERVAPSVLGPRPEEDDPVQLVRARVDRVTPDRLELSWDVGEAQGMAGSAGEVRRLSLLVAGEARTSPGDLIDVANPTDDHLRGATPFTG